MSARRIIFACFLGLISAQTARAEIACDTLSHMIESVSLVRQIQTVPGGPAYQAQIERLGAVTSQISLPDLIPDTPAATRPTERDALIRYVLGLREAVSGAASGHERYARQTLETIITPAVFGGLSSLETHWGCGGEDDSQPSDDDRDTGTTAYAGANGGDTDNSQKNLSNPTESTPNTRDQPTNDSAGDGTSFRRESAVTGNTMTLFIMLLVMGLIGVFFFAQSRARKNKARETRRSLNILVTVQMDGQNHDMRLVDISMNGFKVRHSGLIDGQENLTIAIGDTWHPGHVRWANPHYAGVKFRRAIDPGTLASVVENPPDTSTLDAAA